MAKLLTRILSIQTRSLQDYFTEINKFDLLNPEEEVELTKNIKQGDMQALEKLVKANLRFVVSVAKQYIGNSNGLTIEDLVNEGNVGLITAAQRFDETRGFKFISYAVWWIRQSIMKAICEQSRLVRIPMNKLSCLSKINSAFSELEQKFEREPSNDELSAVLDMERTEIESLRKSQASHVSLDVPVPSASGEEETFPLDINDYNIPVAQEVIQKKESMKHDVQRVISSLEERQGIIIKLYFGIDAERCYALDEIGEQVGLTRERVRQIKDIALNKLRRNGRARLLKDYF